MPKKVVTKLDKCVNILLEIHPDIKAESTHSNAGESSPAAGPRVFNGSNSANRETAEQANGEPPASGEMLVVYSKPGCCLCDGLKDKLQLILASPSTPVLREVTLEVNCRASICYRTASHLVVLSCLRWDSVQLLEITARCHSPLDLTVVIVLRSGEGYHDAARVGKCLPVRDPGDDTADSRRNRSKRFSDFVCICQRDSKRLCASSTSSLSSILTIVLPFS